MLTVKSIKKGIVIDHIKAGKSMDIYNYLGLGRLDCSVAIIKNASSERLGKKDIIKIEDEIDIDMDALGFIDPDMTVNIIENNKIIKKVKLKAPKTITNVLKCKNPRCITSIEKEIDHVFVIGEEKPHNYRCLYCEHENNVIS